LSFAVMMGPRRKRRQCGVHGALACRQQLLRA
jgi:hypothetical protein